MQPIPTLKHPENWQTIAIEESEEPLVQVSKLKGNKIFAKPMYHLQNIPGSLNECYVRKEVAERLIKAANNLPSGITLLVYDGYRPFIVQKYLYDKYYERIKKEHSALPEDELNELVKQFVSMPSDSSAAPSTHLTGGAVDVTLADRDGRELKLGTVFDDFTEAAHTRYFEDKLENGENLSKEEQEFLENRRLLFHTLTSCGFVNFPNEWWHFDFGNQWWASITGNTKAKYSVGKLSV